MAFDTKYRPLRYEDVLGQDEYKAVLRQIVEDGTGFHQSYLFCGQHGSGKTTLGRILARALLCANPQDGNPCDECDSCLAVLEDRSECFTEFDAATNSGKDDIKKITEELQYSTFSGKQRIYLFDESHQLSKQALDAMLKPMEDSQPGTEDKQLICIFCTTEPERMRSTIFSRCAPAFTIRPVDPEKIADRLAYVCEQEGIEYERAALVLLAEFHESHIRDALKSLEGISKLGEINQENANAYLRLQANGMCLDILTALGTDLARVFDKAEALHELLSPSVSYKRLAEIAMLAYKVKIGAGHVPMFWDADKLGALGDHHAEYLLLISEHLSVRPARPSQAMLLCDLAHLHHGKLGTLPSMSLAPAATQPPTTPVSTVSPPQRKPSPSYSTVAETSTTSSQTASSSEAASLGKVASDPVSDPAEPAPNQPSGTEVEHEHAPPPQPTSPTPAPGGMSDTEFYRAALQRRLAELSAGRGSKRQADMGGR